MKTTIPLAVLIEANECLKLARAAAAPGTYVRILDSQCHLEAYLESLLADHRVEVAQ